MLGKNRRQGRDIIPQSVATNATATGTVDVAGWDYMTIDFTHDTAAATSNNPATLQLAEGTVTTYASHTTITEFVGDGTGGFTIPAADTSNAQIYRFNVDLRGRKRYLSIAATTAGAATIVGANATLSRPNVGPTSDTARGQAVSVTG